MRSLRRLTLALLLALVGGLAACSDDDGDAGPDVGLEARDGEARDDEGDEGDEGDQGDEGDPGDEGDEGDPGDEGDEGDDGTPDDGGDLPAGAAPYVDALTAELSGAGDFLLLTEERARCVATRFVGIARLDRIEAAGITPQQFAEDGDLTTLGMSLEEGRAFYDAFEACGNDYYDAFIEAMATGAADPAATETCIRSVVSRDEMRESVARSIVEPGFDDDPESDELFNRIFACPFDDAGSGDG